uniref:Uncharacterized protein n=1 Tax=Anguilla anguilla TaxID=7936 RepID=A0A0E9UPI4_ANGAN
MGERGGILQSCLHGTITRWELLAVVATVQRFKTYPNCHDFKVHTDFCCIPLD